MSSSIDKALGRLTSLPRKRLAHAPTPLERLANLERATGADRLYVKRDDCTGLAFGGNKARQLEFYFGAAVQERADTILITGAVQSNFVRSAAAAANQLGMRCVIQHEARVDTDDPLYHSSGNVLLDRLLGASLLTYPDGEDEAGADRRLHELADELRRAGRRPYVIPLAAGHPPLGALGYVVAAAELRDQIAELGQGVMEVVVASGSAATHGGLLFGLKALGSELRVTGVCVRRPAQEQRVRVHATCAGIAELLSLENPVTDDDVQLIDGFLAPGYGVVNTATIEAMKTGARLESLILDPVYTGKAFAGFLERAEAVGSDTGLTFLHTGGSPALFAYQNALGPELTNGEDAAA